VTGLVEAPPAPAEAVSRPGERVEAAAAAPSSAPSRSWRDLAVRGRPLVHPACWYLLSRAAVLVAALIARSIFPKLRVVRAMGTVWDGTWYLAIAQHGYPHRLYDEGDGSRWAFFPGFPAAVRALAVVTHLALPDAAVVAAFVFGLTSALAVWLAVREVFGARLADRAVLLYVFCPTAYVLSLAYTEGLFLTAAALCLFALSRRYWVTAALCACVAGLTRNAGIVVVAAVLVTALPAARRERRWRPVVAASVAPLGFASFMAYGWAMVGTPLAFLSAERFWHGQHFIWFLSPVEAMVVAVHQGPGGVAFLPDAMAGAALILGFLGIWLLDRLSGGLRTVGGAVAAVPAAWWVYTMGTLLIAYSAYFTDSIPRYAMAAFPLFVAFAWKLPRSWEGAVVGVMACLQGALLVAMLSAAVHPMAAPLLP
jgi:Dolichyl-phosphate-mannose-protein mannosyltransferase